jgi:hypothetical protein
MLSDTAMDIVNVYFTLDDYRKYVVNIYVTHPT